MKIAIDAGHTNNYNQGILPTYFEGNAMYALSLYLKDELEKYSDVEIFMVRDNLYKDPPLDARSKVAVDNGCDMFLSLHSNAFDGINAGSAQGTEIYYSVHRPASKSLADIIGAAIVVTMKTDIPTTYYRGSKTRKLSVWQNVDWYSVIRNAVGKTGNTAVKHALLIEHGYHTNILECAWLNNKENLKKLAAAEAAVIADVFKLKKPEIQLFRVQLGAFSVKANADALVKKLKADGYDAIIV